MTYRQLLDAIERARALVESRDEARDRMNNSHVPAGHSHSPGWWEARMQEYDRLLDEEIVL